MVTDGVAGLGLEVSDEESEDEKMKDQIPSTDSTILLDQDVKITDELESSGDEILAAITTIPYVIGSPALPTSLPEDDILGPTDQIILLPAVTTSGPSVVIDQSFEATSSGWAVTDGDIPTGFDMGVQDIATELDTVDIMRPATISEDGSGYYALPETLDMTPAPPLKYVTTSSMTTAAKGKELVVFFSLRVTNMRFSDDLFNRSSSEYKALEQQFMQLEATLCAESTCSICLEYSKDPVIIPEFTRWFCFIVNTGTLNTERRNQLIKNQQGLQSENENVTLDPDTAHPRLILSEDRKSVRWGDKKQALPDNPERFSDWHCVLGREGFTAGRHFWEVTVGSEGEWAVGVARKSLRRKDDFLMRIINTFCELSYEEGIWAVGKLRGKYTACTSPDSSPLSLSEEPRRIRVTLDCEAGEISFTGADSGAELYTFSGASFSGETFLPFFYLRGDKIHLRIS
uniref:uncharacterized protein LOC114591020 n=1 Tax=Podarcis muralis TaxID=64176 RepID=UPI00109F5556|nr:uncharacterized protein LOC114591020 [Podarcis muralis]